MISVAQLRESLPFPAVDAHKYSRGKCVLVAGSAAYPGAACLAAKASQFAGAGYTQVYTAPENRLTLRLYRPSLVVSSFDEAEADEMLKPQAQGGFVVGPGFDARDPQTCTLLRQVLSLYAAPVLVDGGALSWLPSLRQEESWNSFAAIRRSALVLTPHAGEAARLGKPFGIDTNQLSQEEAARALSVCYGATVVFKGPDTVVAQTARREWITNGTAALSKAGTGDVLAGTIGGLLAQGMEPFMASVVGAYIHAEAGSLAAQRYGVISTSAEEMLEALPEAFRNIANQ